MVNYKIKVKVEMVECDESPDKNVLQENNDGTFEMIIDESDACSIDNSERALLTTAYPSIRQALAKHLEEVSKKKPSKKPESKKSK